MAGRDVRTTLTIEARLSGNNQLTDLERKVKGVAAALKQLKGLKDLDKSTADVAKRLTTAAEATGKLSKNLQQATKDMQALQAAGGKSGKPTIEQRIANIPIRTRMSPGTSDALNPFAFSRGGGGGGGAGGGGAGSPFGGLFGNSPYSRTLGNRVLSMSGAGMARFGMAGIAAAIAYGIGKRAYNVGAGVGSSVFTGEEGIKQAIEGLNVPGSKLLSKQFDAAKQASGEALEFRRQFQGLRQLSSRGAGTDSIDQRVERLRRTQGLFDVTQRNALGQGSQAGAISQVLDAAGSGNFLNTLLDERGQRERASKIAVETRDRAVDKLRRDEVIDDYKRSIRKTGERAGFSLQESLSFGQQVAEAADLDPFTKQGRKAQRLAIRAARVGLSSDTVAGFETARQAGFSDASSKAMVRVMSDGFEAGLRRSGQLKLTEQIAREMMEFNDTGRRLNVAARTGMVTSLSQAGASPELAANIAQSAGRAGARIGEGGGPQSLGDWMMLMSPALHGPMPAQMTADELARRYGRLDSGEAFANGGFVNFLRESQGGLGGGAAGAMGVQTSIFQGSLGRGISLGALQDVLGGKISPEQADRLKEAADETQRPTSIKAMSQVDQELQEHVRQANERLKAGEETLEAFQKFSDDQIKALDDAATLFATSLKDLAGSVNTAATIINQLVHLVPTARPKD